MPHADSSLVPATIQSKADFWAHVYTQLVYLLESERNWVCSQPLMTRHCRLMDAGHQFI
jgi:hypothetical protein